MNIHKFICLFSWFKTHRQLRQQINMQQQEIDSLQATIVKYCQLLNRMEIKFSAYQTNLMEINVKIEKLTKSLEQVFPLKNNILENDEG